LPQIGVITGTRREASCLGRLSQDKKIIVACSGADPVRARSGAQRLLSDGCEALVSFGVAGGIDPALPSGGLVIATSVMSQDGRQSSVSDGWRTTLEAELEAASLDFVSGPIVGVDQAITDREPKRLLHAGTGARCVDMESHAVMDVALAAGVPWLVIRAIADCADDELPDIALDAINEKGGVRAVMLTARLLRHPSDISDLIGLWQMSRPAFTALGRVASLPGFCRPL
jgi:adenosylhomocysteine nucleosidase